MIHWNSGLGQISRQNRHWFFPPDFSRRDRDGPPSLFLSSSHLLYFSATSSSCSLMTSLFSEVLSSLGVWEGEDSATETPTQRALKKLPEKKKTHNEREKRSSRSSEAESGSSSSPTDLHELNALARLRCWAAIEECAAQVDAIHHTTLTKAGNAPLHSAISNGAPLSTIQALVVANPPSVAFPNHFGNLPLHFVAWKNKSTEAFAVCEFLLTYYPQAARHANRHGNLPLHHATNYKAHPDLVQLLWRAYPGAIEIRNDKGQTPLDHAMHRLGKHHDVVKMLQGSTSRNFVYHQQQHSQQPSSIKYLNVVANNNHNRGLRSQVYPEEQKDVSSNNRETAAEDLRYSTAKEALPEIKTDTWHEVDLS